LGSRESNEKEVQFFLKTVKCDRLILAGDIFDLWFKSPKQIRKKYKDLIEVLNQRAKNIEIIYIIGNHDFNYRKDPIFCSDVKVVDNFVIDDKIIVIHGHEFDTLFFRLTQKPLAKLNEFVRSLLHISAKDIHNNGRKAITRLRENAINKYCIKSRYKMVIAGHVHDPENGLRYFNAGDWKIGEHNTYVVIEDDKVRLERYSI
jgi:UDP-2,3-diacylglucosamine pyrophosphatase LpxH